MSTANQRFKDRYPLVVRVALAAALAAHALAFVLAPALSVSPYRLPPEDPIETIDTWPDDPVVLPRVAEAPLPARPQVEAVDPVEPPPAPAPPPPPSASAPGEPALPRAGGDTPRFWAFDDEPELVEFAAPRYPRLAREAGIEGRVLVRVRVDERGRVVDAVVVASDVTPAMEEAALHAARACRFKAARQRDVPVSAHVTIPFAFSLR